MMMLYGARSARPDLLRAIGRLAGYLTPRARGASSVAELLGAARRLCAEDYSALSGRMRGVDKLTPDGAVAWRCFDLVYAARLLLDGYGFAEAADVEFVGDVGGTEVEWTLGALYAKLEERAQARGPGLWSPLYAKGGGGGAPMVIRSAMSRGSRASFVPPRMAWFIGLTLTGFVAHHMYVSYCAGPPARGKLRVEPRDAYTPVAGR